MLNWYVGIIHDYVLCAPDRNKSDDSISGMGKTDVIHDLISYIDEGFLFLLLVLVNNHDDWMKRVLRMNRQTDLIHKGCIMMWTHNQYIGKDNTVHTCKLSGWASEGRDFLNKAGRFFPAVQEADKSSFNGYKKMAKEWCLVMYL